jgi:serine/threonine-protein kinase
MERLEGRTLGQRLVEEGSLSWEELRDPILDVLSALGAAHEKGIVHLDLKPDNVFLVDRPGHRPLAKLLDFGIAKTPLDGAAGLRAAPGRSESVRGTPYYMAPEQARGDADVDGRADVWAVGVIIYEALTGVRPFDARNYNALLVQILSAEHRALGNVQPGAPAGLAEVVDRALVKAASGRFESALSMMAALRRAGSDVPVGSSSGSRREEHTVLLRGSPLRKSEGRAPTRTEVDLGTTWVDHEPMGFDDDETVVRDERPLGRAPS